MSEFNLSTGPAAVQANGPQAADKGLKLLVLGFNDMERKLLQGVVFLSKRRAPRIDLISEQDLSQADVIMVDAHDHQAMTWAHDHPALNDKAVIWVDGHHGQAGHTLARRPVQWPVLPVLLFQALEKNGKQHLSDKATPPGNCKVLVIDDSLPARAHLKSLLQSRGMSVDEAVDAQSGLRADANTGYACILLDVMMPGMDGYEACRRIKSAHAGGKAPAVVMLTSKSSPFDRIRGKMAGCDDYLAKPVEPERLYQVLSQFIRTDANGSSTHGAPSSYAQPRFAHS